MSVDQTLTLNSAAAINNAGFLLTLGGTASFTLNGPISGSGGLTKAGSNTCVLAAANTYTGNTTVNQGILRLPGDTGRIDGGGSTGGDVILNPGGTLDITNANTANPDRIDDAAILILNGGTFHLGFWGRDGGHGPLPQPRLCLGGDLYGQSPGGRWPRRFGGRDGGSDRPGTLGIVSGCKKP